MITNIKTNKKMQSRKEKCLFQGGFKDYKQGQEVLYAPKWQILLKNNLQFERKGKEGVRREEGERKGDYRGNIRGSKVIGDR